MSELNENQFREQYRPKEHPDSDPELITSWDEQGNPRGWRMNMLGCGSAGCPATFNKVENRAAHMKSAHPGEYRGPTEEMLALSEIMKENYGDDAGLGKTF